jgi:hypothetical protein
MEGSSILKCLIAKCVPAPLQQHDTFFESQILLADIVFIPIKTTPLYSHSKELHPIFDFSPLTQPSANIPFTPFIPIHKAHTHKEQSTGTEKRRRRKVKDKGLTIDILSGSLTNAHIERRITWGRRKQLLLPCSNFKTRGHDLAAAVVVLNGVRGQLQAKKDS